MKKAILPAVISAALLATSAHAANLYNTDGTSVDFSGEVDGLYSSNEYDLTGDDNSGKISNWAQASFDVSTEISDSVTGMASFDFETDGSDVVLDDAWVGFAGDFGTIKIGETGSSYGILEKAELINEGNDYDVVYSDAEGSGHSIRYQKTVGAVALSANYFLDGTAKDDAGASAPIEGFAVSADYAADAFTIGAGYIDSGDDATGLGISASYETDALFLAATYSINTKDSDSDNDFSTAAVSASYAFGDVASLYGSYQINDGDKTDLTNWYVGVSKDITANIYAFVEYNYTEQDEDGVFLDDDSTYSEDSSVYAGVYYAF